MREKDRLLCGNVFVSLWERAFWMSFFEEQRYAKRRRALCRKYPLTRQDKFRAGISEAFSASGLCFRACRLIRKMLSIACFLPPL